MKRKPASQIELEESAAPANSQMLSSFQSPMDIAIAASKWQPDWNIHKKKPNYKAFKDPYDLWIAACDYFNYTQKNPLVKYEFVKTGPLAGSQVPTAVPRPFSWSGLNVYLVTHAITCNLNRYRYNDGNAYDDYQDIIKLIEDVMFSQKFEGAAVGIYKENIIAREIGLAERNKTDVVIDQPLFEL